MSKSTLFWQVYERLVEDEELEPVPKRLVEASFTSADAIRAALEKHESGLATESSVAEHTADAVPSVYLERLDVTGFRGVGETTTLQFEAGPGLTVVVGRNGSGKSSIAEGLEVLLTGDSLRWKKDRNQKDWLSGWKNLHVKGRTWIRGTFLVEGDSQSLQLQRSWSTDDFDEVDFEGSSDTAGVVAHWEEALETFRPILSYNEIGHALDKGPSHLYDLLRGVLGMEELTQAVDQLAAQRKELRKADKERKAQQAALEKALSNSEDERVPKIEEALSGRSPDLEALTDLVLDEMTGDAEVAVLRRTATMQLPAETEVLSTAQSLREAVEAVEKAREMLAEEEGKTLELLRLALSLYEHETEQTCPVCGTSDVLTEKWHESATERIEASESATRARRDAGALLKSAVQEAGRLVGKVPDAPDSELDARAPAAASREVWRNTPEDPLELADHLETHFDAVDRAYAVFRTAAEEELQSLQAEWRPIRRSIEAFIEAHGAWDVAKAQIKDLKAAETWLKKADVELRNERFAPICEQAQAIWEMLRHRSNVSLNDIRLEGSKTRRRVELEVAVDGEDAVALGVMSQGELHSMLLSLFLPRLTLGESPFRFLVVDDPVQAMDPAKVDGLARVLADVAETRQVVVFTHDARLPEALRRMQIPARIVEVKRAERSVVTLRDTRSRPAQFLSDAWQVAKDRHNYGPRVAPNVVPGLCRGAVEAHLQSKAWEMLLRSGRTQVEVEEEIADSKNVHSLAALAFFGDSNRGGDVYSYLNNKVDRGTDTFKILKDGAHGGFKGDVEMLIRDTQQLLRGLGADI